MLFWTSLMKKKGLRTLSSGTLNILSVHPSLNFRSNSRESNGSSIIRNSSYDLLMLSLSVRLGSLRLILPENGTQGVPTSVD